MIRLSTLIWLALASVAAGMVMHVSYRVQRTESHVSKVEREIVREQEQIRVLDAEWSYLNDPSRIEALARRHLQLGPTSAKKIVSMEQVPMGLRKLTDPNAAAPGPLLSKLVPLAPASPALSVSMQAMNAPAPAPVIAQPQAQPATTVAVAPAKAPDAIKPQELVSKPSTAARTQPATAKPKSAPPAPAPVRGNDAIGNLILTTGGR